MALDNTKKYIVITSIFEPTVGVRAFAEMQDYKLIVVGDKKSPQNWHYPGVDFVSIAEQDASKTELAQVLPYNHYCRKMLGYIKAIQAGASCIVDTDDDNIPKENWRFPAFDYAYETTPQNLGFVNMYQLYTKDKIWPRGLPLRLINEQFDLDNTLTTEHSKVGIWQGLADEDPDVDAVYRLTHGQACYFDERPPVVVNKGTISPFNTQNTLVRKELFPLLYLPTQVTHRYTDILRGLVAQPIMWLYGFQLGFTNATVVQKRNPHDFMEDFKSEIPMYETCEKVIELVTQSVSSSQSMESNLYNAYETLMANDIVGGKELETLTAWLKDIGS